MTHSKVTRWLKALWCVAAFPFFQPSIVTAQPYQPQLRIAVTNPYVTVSWPQSAYYSALIVKMGFSQNWSWFGLVTAASDFTNKFPIPIGQTTTNFTDSEITFRAPTGIGQVFFALEAPRPIPIFQFGAFYDGLMEFSTVGDMTLGGPVHANGDIYSGTGGSVTFNRTVTTSGALAYPAWNGQGPDWSSLGTFKGVPPYVTNVPRFSVLMGTNTSNPHAITNPHALIEMPPDGEDPTSEVGAARFYNQAQVVLLVSNDTVTAKIQNGSANSLPASDPAPIILTTNLTDIGYQFPFLSLTNSFTDQRERKVVNVTQIDIGLYRGWLKSNFWALTKFPYNSTSYPSMFYVADCRTNLESTMSAVRIANATNVPYNGGHGFTLATSNPLYVWGDYNFTTNSPSSTNAPVPAPAALISDALTILSTRWKDSASAGSLNSRYASSAETVNAAIITGNVPSTGSSATNFSGGVHNLPRLLESWSSSTLWLNTSLVCLYQSTIATNQFLNPGVYYNPPTRKFNWDTNFVNTAKLPPGCPMVGFAPGAEDVVGGADASRSIQKR